MKNLLFCTALLMMLSIGSIAQEESENTPFLGIKAGLSYTGINLSGDNPDKLTSQWISGFTGGLFGNIPLGKKFSIQPELLYNQMGGRIVRSSVYSPTKYKLNYFSLPIMLKYWLGDDLRLLAGVQGDIMLFALQSEAGVNTDVIGDLDRGQWAITGGAEWWPSYNWGIGARYIQGMSEINEGATPSFKNAGLLVTLNYRFGKKPAPAPPPPPPPPPPADRDKDGILDDVDKCPDVPGIAKYQGCPIPDTDKDGINDEQDSCVTVPGVAKYKGCPVPDTDGDGINDEQDSCVTVPGIAKYKGCPIPDTDNDGVNDEEDKCPTIAGVPENGGCPLIKFNAANVQFASGTATLTKGAKTELNKAVQIMNVQYPDIKVAIIGHTDNTGKPETNQKLSESRAEAVKKYLVSKGVSADRLTASGAGADSPIEDNGTAAGKAKNRRVEFKLSQ